MGNEIQQNCLLNKLLLYWSAGGLLSFSEKLFTGFSTVKLRDHKKEVSVSSSVLGKAHSQISAVKGTYVSCRRRKTDISINGASSVFANCAVAAW